MKIYEKSQRRAFASKNLPVSSAESAVFPENSRFFQEL